MPTGLKLRYIRTLGRPGGITNKGTKTQTTTRVCGFAWLVSGATRHDASFRVPMTRLQRRGTSHPQGYGSSIKG